MTVRCFAQLAIKSGRRMFQNEKKGRAGSVQTQTALSSAEKPLRRVRRKEGVVMAIENKIREVCEDLGGKWNR